MVNQKRLIDNFMKMVKVSSLSGQEGAFRDLLIGEFAALGLAAEEDRAGEILHGDSGNLLFRLQGSVDRPPLLLAAHMDTVVPGTGINPVRGGDDVIRSEGDTILASDDKAGIAAILEAVQVILEKGLDHPPLEILFTVSEEQGLLGIKNFDFSCLQSRYGYVLDSGGEPGTIVVQSPCQNEIEYRVRGKAAHAGINPEDGINAIQIMAKALAVMPCGRMDEETTCNFGIIEGGRARNIVAENCRVKGEVRSLQRRQLESLTAELLRIFRAEVEKNGGVAETEVILLYPETALNPEEEVVRLAVQAAGNIGLRTELLSTGGGSDASIINGNNIRCANLGIGMNAVHTSDEFIRVEDLVNDARLVLGIIEEAVRL
ncbi:MAG: M20/M25/M40 family metallo-hydrolase [Syntrophomonadaceae bacterium]|nr:M20/M25/M40 family metallo-hydrolase [Syntrophomonadaceae bacterium]